MDPQTFIRLSISSLGLRVSDTSTNGGLSTGIPTTLYTSCSCEIRLRGFPVQTTSIPFITSSDVVVTTATTTSTDSNNASLNFYLEESDLKALLAPRCIYTSHACLEVVVFGGRKRNNCVVGIKKQKIGTFRLRVGQEWVVGKPVILFNGWIGIGKNKKQEVELHIRVKLDPDPRYVFQFEDATKLSPLIVQLQGTNKQPIFSCKFSQDRVSETESLNNFWSNTSEYFNQETERRERKGWKVQIHDLSGSAVAAAFITTPFVPATGCDWVAKSNPGAWLIVRPDVCRPESWQPWGKLEAWRERGTKDFVFCRFNLLSEGHENGDILMSELLISTDKGGEFFIDTDRQARGSVVGSGPQVPSPQSSGDFSGLSPPVVGGFVMSCRVQGEGKCSKPLVQLAMRHITCVEDAAIFMALAAAVGLSVEACRPFRRKIRRQG